MWGSWRRRQSLQTCPHKRRVQSCTAKGQPRTRPQARACGTACAHQRTHLSPQSPPRTAQKRPKGLPNGLINALRRARCAIVAKAAHEVRQAGVCAVAQQLEMHGAIIKHDQKGELILNGALKLVQGCRDEALVADGEVEQGLNGALKLVVQGCRDEALMQSGNSSLQPRAQENDATDAHVRE